MQNQQQINETLIIPKNWPFKNISLIKQIDKYKFKFSTFQSSNLQQHQNCNWDFNGRMFTANLEKKR